MAKAEIKTKQNDASVEEFLDSVADDGQRGDSFRLLEMFKSLTGEEPKMWGPAIIGFGAKMCVSPGTSRASDKPRLATYNRLFIGAATCITNLS